MDLLDLTTLARTERRARRQGNAVHRDSNRLDLARADVLIFSGAHDLIAVAPRKVFALDDDATPIGRSTVGVEDILRWRARFRVESVGHQEEPAPTGAAIGKLNARRAHTPRTSRFGEDRGRRRRDRRRHDVVRQAGWGDYRETNA